MNNILTSEERMVDYIVGNLNHVQTIVKPLKSKRDTLMNSESSVFIEDINSQYERAIRSAIAIDMCIQMPGINPDEAFLFVEKINIGEL